MHDATIELSVDVDQPAEKVFDFLTSPEKIPLVMPSLVENVDIPPLPLKNGSRFHYRYQMYGVMLEGSWSVVRADRPTAYEAQTEGDIASHWIYRLSPSAGGGTHVDMSVTYETPKNVAARIKSELMLKINRTEGETYLQNLKTVLEMGA
jgi:uncharacterized protein YndB with AHSA1/START domain